MIEAQRNKKKNKKEEKKNFKTHGIINPHGVK